MRDFDFYDFKQWLLDNDTITTEQMEPIIETVYAYLAHTKP